MVKQEVYKQICQEILAICKMYPDFLIGQFIIEENVTLEDGNGFLYNLKNYREQLELDSNIICDDEEVQAIMDEGLRIQSILIKERMNGD
jgi:hypothetical protein